MNSPRLRLAGVGGCLVLLLAGCFGGKPPMVSATQVTVQDLNRKGVESDQRGDAARALEHFGEALRLSASIEYLDGSVASLLNLARLQRRAGRLDQAAAHGERAAQLAGAGGRAGEVAFERALVYLAQGRLEAALQQARSAVDVAGDAAERGVRLNLLARVQMALHDAAAPATATAALTLNREADNRPETANSERLLAELALGAGQVAVAEQGFLRALQLDKTSGLSVRIAADLRGLADCAARRGATDEEVRYLHRAFEVSLNGRDRAAASGALERLAALYRAAGDPERAAALERERAALGGSGPLRTDAPH